MILPSMILHFLCAFHPLRLCVKIRFGCGSARAGSFAVPLSAFPIRISLVLRPFSFIIDFSSLCRTLAPQDPGMEIEDSVGCPSLGPDVILALPSVMRLLRKNGQSVREDFWFTDMDLFEGAI